MQSHGLKMFHVTHLEDRDNTCRYHVILISTVNILEALTILLYGAKVQFQHKCKMDIQLIIY